ncbi:MAG: hypothetical protein M3Y31_06040 [Gemmatimonadota bacterium]|nr:hypothetical protein [Gemmatimonadota bacterium]
MIRVPLRTARSSWPLLLFAAAAVSACDAPGRAEPDPVPFAAGTDTLMIPLRVVTSGAWLGGERWVITSPDDGVVRLVELGARDTIMPFGDAAAFQHPHFVFADQDTAWIGDWGRRRVTVWSPDGTLLDSVPALTAASGALPRGVDAAGQLYAEVYPLPTAEVDSGVVLRIAPDLQRADTAAQLAPYDLAEVREDRGVRMQRRAMSGSDAWGVLPDGTVWVARVDQNRVDWVSPQGEITRGRGLPDRVLEVTRADRELFLQQYPQELRAEAERLPFAIVKPPFERGFTSGTNQVWLEKSRAIGDSTRRYHVLDRAQGFLGERHLRGLGRILAVGDDAALLAEVVPDSGTRLIRVPVE